MNNQTEKLNTEKKLWEQPKSEEINIQGGQYVNNFEGGSYFSAP